MLYQFFNKFTNTNTNNRIQSNKYLRGISKQADITELSISEQGFENTTKLNIQDLKKQFLSSSNKNYQKQKENEDNNTNNQVNNNIINWKQLIQIIQQRHRINNKKTKYIKNAISDELKLISQDIRTQRQKNIKQLQNLRINYQNNIKSKQDIIMQITKLKDRIQQLTKVLNTKNRTTQTHQEIYKMQLDVRMKKVQIQNLEVKLTMYNDLIKSSSYQLYKKCTVTNNQLEGRLLQVYNKKLWNYLKQILQDQEKYSKAIFQKIRKYSFEKQTFNKEQNQQKTALSKRAQYGKGLDNLTFPQLLQIYIQRQKTQTNVKQFFDQLKKFYLQLNVNLKDTLNIIQECQKQFFQKLNQQTYSQNNKRNSFSKQGRFNDNEFLSTLTTNYSIHLFYDRYFLDTICSLARKDQKITHLSSKIIQNQIQIINQYLQVSSKPFAKSVRKLNQVFRSLQQDKKKLQKTYSKTNNTNDEYEKRKTQLIHKTEEVEQQLKRQINNLDKLHIKSLLNNLMSEIIEKQLKIYQYLIIHEKKASHLEQKTQIEEQQYLKNQKLKEYQTYALKIQNHNFDDPLYETLSRNNKNKAQIKKKIQNKNGQLNKGFEKLNQDNQEQKFNLKEKHLESKQESLKMINRLLGVFFQEWSNSQFFHQIIKQQLQISLNFKRPGLVQPIHIEHLKIQEKTKQSGFQDINPQSTQIFRCLFDVKINFKGKIAVHIKTKLNFGNRTPVNINLLIKQFKCPLRICFTPYSIGKSYVSLLQRPHLNIQYDVKIGQWHINKIPFFSQFLKIFIILKMRKKMLWPKRITLSVPLAFKNPLSVAIRERTLFQNQKLKRKIN